MGNLVGHEILFSPPFQLVDEDQDMEAHAELPSVFHNLGNAYARSFNFPRALGKSFQFPTCHHVMQSFPAVRNVGKRCSSVRKLSHISPSISLPIRLYITIDLPLHRLPKGPNITTYQVTIAKARVVTQLL